MILLIKFPTLDGIVLQFYVYKKLSIQEAGHEVRED